MSPAPRRQKKPSPRAVAQLTEVKRFRFPKKEKAQLTSILSEKLNLPPNSRRVRLFLRDVAMAIAVFHRLRALDSSRPSTTVTRSTLDQLRKHVPGVRQAMEAGDPGTQHLLMLCLQDPWFYRYFSTDEKGNPPAIKRSERSEADVQRRIYAEKDRRKLLEDLLAQFTLVLAVIDEASEMARGLIGNSPRGPTPDHWRAQFAADVASAYKRNLEFVPTASAKGEFTKESAFESVLRGCFQTAGIKLSDVHKFALAALQRLREQERPDSEL